MFTLSQRHRLRTSATIPLMVQSFRFVCFSTIFLSVFFFFSFLLLFLFCFFTFFFIFFLFFSFYFFLFFLFIYFFFTFFYFFFRQKVCRSRQFSGSYRLDYERHVFFLMVHHPATIRNRRLLVWCHIKSLRRSRTHKIWKDVVRSICLSFWCSIRAALVIMLLEGSWYFSVYSPRSGVWWCSEEHLKDPHFCKVVDPSIALHSL